MNMGEYKEVFDILYDIKDIIPDGKYLRLNNLIMKLYNDARLNRRNVLPDDEETTIISNSTRISDEKWEEIEQIGIGNFYGKISSFISTIEYFEQPIECNCESNDPFFVCNANRRSFFNCKNYMRFVDKNPIILNLIDRKKQINFTSSPIHNSNVNFSYFKFNIFNHINLIKNLVLAKDRCIVLISLYDYIMKNIENLRGRPGIIRDFICKIDEFKENTVFMSFMQFNRFDPERWKIFLQELLV